MTASPVTTLFLDIGGVLLTNGWDRPARRLAAEKFGLDEEETTERHELTFGTYEEGKLTLEEYLGRVVFFKPRSFSLAEFRDFMYSRSLPYLQMIDLVRGLKARYGLRVAAVSNEGRELMDYRLRTFGLTEFVDFFISSCYVHFRKPDPDIYRLALDISQAQPEQVIYVEDRPMFVEVAQGLGIRGIIHTSYDSTRAALASLGLALENGSPLGSASA